MQSAVQVGSLCSKDTQSEMAAQWALASSSVRPFWVASSLRPAQARAAFCVKKTVVLVSLMYRSKSAATTEVLHTHEVENRKLQSEVQVRSLCSKDTQSEMAAQWALASSSVKPFWVASSLRPWHERAVFCKKTVPPVLLVSLMYRSKPAATTEVFHTHEVENRKLQSEMQVRFLCSKDTQSEMAAQWALAASSVRPVWEASSLRPWHARTAFCVNVTGGLGVSAAPAGANSTTSARSAREQEQCIG